MYLVAAPLLILPNHFRTCHTASLGLLNLREPGKCPADEGSKDPQQTGRDRQTATAGPVYDRKKEVLLPDEMGLR